MKLLPVLVIIVSVVIIINASMMMYSFNSRPAYLIKQIQMDMTIGNAIGLTVDKDALHFGTVFPGSSVARRLSLVTDKRMLLTFSSEGSISPYVHFPTEGILFVPDVNQTIPIVVKVPKNSEFGTYDGVLTLKFEEVNYDG